MTSEDLEARARELEKLAGQLSFAPHRELLRAQAADLRVQAQRLQEPRSWTPRSQTSD